MTREKLPIRIKLLHPDAKVPTYATDGSVGCDLHCVEDVVLTADIGSHHTTLIDVGIALEIPPGWEAQVRPRSGLSAKGILVHFGTIDSDYRGPIRVSANPLGYKRHLWSGDRIAQLVFQRVPRAEFEVVDELSETDRGEKGFGSSGR